MMWMSRRANPENAVERQAMTMNLCRRAFGFSLLLIIAVWTVSQVMPPANARNAPPGPQETKEQKNYPDQEQDSGLHNKGLRTVKVAPEVIVSGIIKTEKEGRPVAGAVVGLFPLESEGVTAEELLSWAHTDSEGRFKMKKSVSQGRYKVRANALGYKQTATTIEIDGKSDRGLHLEISIQEARP
jgi:hypothetical protein